MPQNMRSAVSLNYLKKVNTDMNWRKLQTCILLNTDFKIDIINDMLHVLYCMDLYNFFFAYLSHIVLLNNCLFNELPCIPVDYNSTWPML